MSLYLSLLRSALFSLIIVSLAVGQSSTKGPAVTTSEKDAVVNTLLAMWYALAHGDLDRYASFIHPDFTSFGEDDAYLSSGKDLELRNYAAYLKRVHNLHTDMHQPEVTVRGDVAWVTYYWTESVESADGKHTTSRGKSTRIFVKENGKWQCIHGHYTAVP